MESNEKKENVEPNEIDENASNENDDKENVKDDVKAVKNSPVKLLSKRDKHKITLRHCILTAMFIAFAVVTKSITLINLSAFGIKISFAGVFTFFPAALFGPIYGGIASFSSDVIGYLIKADGAYNPLLSVVAFLGGFIKGLVWRWLTKGISKRIRIVFVSAFVIIGILGVAGNISLINDGILPKNTIFAVKQELPTKDEIAGKKLSPLSKLVTDLAMYNKDNYTLMSAVKNAEGEYVIPINASTDCGDIKITRLGKNALANVEKGSKIYIPGVITKIDPNVFGETIAEDITIITESDSLASKLASDKNIRCEIGDQKNLEVNFLREENKIEFKSDEGFIVKSSDTYRKYLATYTNLAVAGTEFVMVLGCLFILIEYLLSKRKGSKNEGGYLKIASAICASGLVVTTINTFILRSFLPAWQGRMFLILWVPRVAEELIVCLMQAYIISLLYGVIINTRFRKYFVR